MTDIHPLAALARRWSRHVELTPRDRDALLALPITRKPFAKDAYLVRQGQQATDCCLLLRGFAFRQKSLSDGRRQILSIQIATEFVDLQNGPLRVADHSVQSLDRCEVALIPIADILDLAARHPNLRTAMWIDTLIDASIVREWLVNVGRRDARARLAHLLCELALRLEHVGAVRDGLITLPITQEQLADCTGLTAVHTNRTLQSLRRDGLIHFTNGILRVLDWTGLREAGDFDERYLHQQA